jgi:DNA-binding transcriptional MerR regulator
MNKKENEKKGEQKKMVITTRTLVNGYELIVDNEGYMFFNVQSLLEGFMVHVGMKRLEEMTQEEIKDFLKATKDGSLNKKLQAEVNALKEERKELKLQQREMKKEIENLKKELAK